MFHSHIGNYIVGNILNIIEGNIWNFGLGEKEICYGNIVFSGGKICGYDCKNEVTYQVSEDYFCIFDVDGKVSTKFKISEFNEDFWIGQCLLESGHPNHYLSLNKRSPVRLKWNKKFISCAEENNFYFLHCMQRENIYNDNSFLIAYPNSNVEPGATLPGGAIIDIGMFSYVSGYNSTNMRIGRYSSIASGVRTFGNAHPTNWISSSPVFYTNHHQKIYQEATKKKLTKIYYFEEFNDKTPILIGNDVWIGEGCIIKPGITIGDGAIVAANSIVTKDVPSYSIVAGAPAQVRRYRFKDNIIGKLNRIRWWDYDISDVDIDWRDPEKSIDKLEYELSKCDKLNIKVRDFTYEFMKKNISIFSK